MCGTIKRARNGFFIRFAVIASVWGENVIGVLFTVYIYFKGGRVAYTHAATMVRAKLTGAWAKKRGRERA